MPNDSKNVLPNLITISKGYAPLNVAGMALANLAAWHQQRIGDMGLLAAPPEGATTQPLGMPANPVATSQRVWVNEPPGSIPFDPQEALTLTGSVQPELIVLLMDVPAGFDGIIRWISNNLVLTAGTFNPGDFTWSIKINGRPVRNFCPITTEKGTIAQGRQISPIRIFAGDTVTYNFTEATAGHAGTTVCSITGYFFPSKGIS